MDMAMTRQQFQLLSGLDDAACAEQAGLLNLCRLELERSLRPERDIPENGLLLCQLAAVNAYYRYLLGSAGAAGGTVRVLDISIQTDEGKVLERARSLREELKTACRELLRDDGFLFRSV